MYKAVIVTGGLIACLILSSCDSTSSSNTDAVEDTKFTVILQQLEAARGEIRALKGEVVKISKDLDVLKSRQVAQADTARPPSGPTTLIMEDKGVVLGDAKAKIAIVEFTDYQCPYCVRFHSSTFSEIKKNYIDTGKLRYVIRDFPLDFHVQGENAAVAAHCAGSQGKYWEMRDQLFANQKNLGAKLYSRLATQLALDVGSFKTCSKQGDALKRVKHDVEYGQSIGVSGTPNFFVGRIVGTQVVDARQIIGSQPYSAFSNAIDSLIKEN